jgi:class 3 adenylate cyclase
MKESPEIEALLRRMFRAVFVDHNATALQNIGRGSSDPRNRTILAADDEVYQGPGTDLDGEFLVRRAMEMGIVSIEFDLVEAFEEGDVGWAAAILTGHRDGGEPVRSRYTGVFTLEDGVWRTVQWHASLGVPNEHAFGVELTKDLDALVASLDESAGTAIAESSGAGTVTLLFSDVEDSTRMTELVGDTEWAAIISRHLTSLRSAVEDHRGTLVKTLGDGAMAAFGSVTSALDAALDIQRHAGDEPFKIRIGVHTGDAIQADGDYIGTTVNKAARIASAAHPGEIVVSSATAELTTGRGYNLGASRSVELKGLAGTHRITPLQDCI